MGPKDEHAAAVRIAAAGDVHCREANRAEMVRAFAAAGRESDALLLAGDLTSHGQPQQAEIVVEATAAARVPVLAVLGNHDHHCGQAPALAAALDAGGVRVLDREAEVIELNGTEVGIVGTKGFVGGFAGSHLPDFGEPLLRALYKETTLEAEAIDRGLAAVAHCPLRIVLLHYAPVADTLQGEPEGIHTFLGSARLADPVREHEPDLVLHGHAHAGSFEGAIGTTPVRNVSVPAMGRPYWVFELAVPARPVSPIR